MSTILLTLLALSSLLTHLNATTNITQCPTGCECKCRPASCNPTSSFITSITIDCYQSLHYGVDVEQLFHELDSLLSTNHVTEHLTSLTIQRTPLTGLPASICQLLNLTSLYIESNHNITKLPDNCFNNLTKLMKLSLWKNSIDSLPDGLFDGLQSLTKLYLSDNSIVNLPDGLFDGLHSLTTLDLSDNSIVNLPDGLFDGLPRLLTLELAFNLIDSLPDGLFDDLHSLTYLDLSENSIDSLPDMLFDGLQSLRSLVLLYSSIDSLPDGLFDGLQSLTTLYLSYNSIVSLPDGLFDGLQSLTTLYLSYNSIVSLQDGLFDDLQSLMELDLSYNSIVSLPDGLFDGLPRLVTLDLSYNNISFIGLRAFSYGSILDGLRTFDLSHNKMTSLEPWWYQLCTQGFTTRIILSYNLISHFTNKLQVTPGCEWGVYGSPPSGYLDLSHNLITHVMQMFIGWNITIDEKSKCFLRDSPFTFNLAGSNYACDCADFPIYKIAKIDERVNILQGVQCTKEHFHNKFGQPVLASSIPLNDFSCERPVGCPSSCRCAYHPGNYTLHVDCSAANFSSLPLDLPPLVDMYEQPNHTIQYKLDFSNNKLLRRLEHRPYFVNTSILDVSNCSLTEITEEDLKDVAQINVVNFRGNMIESFPGEAKSLNISAQISLGLNPWKCSCHNSWMIECLQSLSHQISDPGDIICRSPARLYGRNVLESTENDFCVDPVQHTLTITLSIVAPIFAIVVILVMTGIVFYKLREKCYKRWKFHPFDRDECIGEDMDYDVFLCCSSEDHNPHGLRILELIESKGYRVCYHLRDFLAGAAIADNMIQSIQRSKRTVCLLSNNFLQSHFCMTEFEMAYHHNVVVKHSKRLIVLMMLDSVTELYDNDASDTATLRQFLRQYTYIDYTTDNDKWLDKLLYALPLRGLLQPNDDHNNDDVPLVEGIQLNENHNIQYI